MTDTDLDISRPKKYFKLHFRLLRFLGLGWWHDCEDDDMRNFPGWYLYYAILTEIIWVVGFVGLETIDPFIGEKDIDRFMFSLSFVITHDLTLIKLYVFFFKNNEIQDVVRTLEIDLFKFYQNNKSIRDIVRTTKIMTGSFLLFGWITIGNTNVYGIMEDYKWKRQLANGNDSSSLPLRTLPQPIYIPWSYQSEASYIFTFVLETLGLLWTGHIVMTIDTFIGSVILHMSCQFRILQEAIVTAYERTMISLCRNINGANVDSRNDFSFVKAVVQYQDKLERLEFAVKSHYTREEIDVALERTFRNCVLQQQTLIRCVKKFSETYSYGFMTQLLSSMAAICVVMVQVSQDASSFKSTRLVTSLAFFIAMIIQLAIQCFTGNELTLQAMAVSDAVMQCKWERLPVRVSRMMLLCMVRAQRPIRLTAAGFANMDNNCFLSIMKAAYSYYAVLSKKQM